MMPGVWAWILVVLRTKPKVSVSFANVSFRVGSLPGSSISLTRGMTRLYARRSGPRTARAGETVLDRRQRVEQHAAHDREAFGGDLVDRVVRSVPGRKVEVDEQRRRHPEAEERRVVVFDGERVGEEVRAVAETRRARPDRVGPPARRRRLAP